jgi:hypothetical protein
MTLTAVTWQRHLMTPQARRPLQCERRGPARFSRTAAARVQFLRCGVFLRFSAFPLFDFLFLQIVSLFGCHKVILRWDRADGDSPLSYCGSGKFSPTGLTASGRETLCFQAVFARLRDSRRRLREFRCGEREELNQDLQRSLAATSRAPSCCSSAKMSSAKMVNPLYRMIMNLHDNESLFSSNPYHNFSASYFSFFPAFISISHQPRLPLILIYAMVHSLHKQLHLFSILRTRKEHSRYRWRLRTTSPMQHEGHVSEGIRWFRRNYGEGGEEGGYLEGL